MKDALEASRSEIVTVAVRRVNLTDRSKESLLDFIPKGMTLLPNTAGCYTAEDAVRAARLGREVGLSHWVKLEVLGDEQTLWPDNEELLAATKTLVKEGFVVFPYTSDDPIVARKLEDAGAAAVMPLGAPIGSGLGIQNPNNIAIILERAKVPVIVDAGVGTASDACVAMELGAAGVLMNTGIAGARRSRPDGGRDARRGRRGARGLSGGTDSEEALRDRIVAARRPRRRELRSTASSLSWLAGPARSQAPRPHTRQKTSCNREDRHVTVRQLLRRPRTSDCRLYVFPSPIRTPPRGDVRVLERGSVLENLPFGAAAIGGASIH